MNTMDQSLLSWTGMGLSVLFASLVALYYHTSNVYSYWRKRGVSGPKPIFLVGNMLQFYYNHTNNFCRNSINEFGRVFGIYEGKKPVLVIADPELVRQICIKDFDVFPNHKKNELLNELNSKFIVFLRDAHWRRVRALLSPTFTSGKMRKMAKLLDQCVDDLTLIFEEHIANSKGDKLQAEKDDSETVVNLKDTYSMYTMDAITSCCYALKLERIANAKDLKEVATRNAFVADALKLFDFDIKRMIVSQMLSLRLMRLIGFEVIPSSMHAGMIRKASALISGRRKSEKKFDDYLQSLLDAKLDDQVDLDDLDTKENHHAELTNDSIRMDQKRLFESVKGDDVDDVSNDALGNKKEAKILSDLEILSNAMFLMTVGLETTASLLTNCTYTLAFHKDVQEKLRDEIRKISKFDENGNVLLDYEAVTSCQYMDAVLSETLRLLAPASQTDREANQDYLIEKYNIQLPKGTKLLIMIEELMMDPEYWSEPHKFDPLRFMPENRDKIIPGSYLPFGIGPRHCLGMRFSLTESKLALAKVLLKYDFSPVKGTKFPPPRLPNFGLRKLANPVVNVRRL